MKKQITLGLIGWLIASIGGYKTLAQETIVTAEPKKETQEITIRKKTDKDTKIIVEINGDKVIVNGKPLAEYNEDGVTINKRKMIIRDGDRIMMDMDGKRMDLTGKLSELDALKNMKNFSFNWNDDGNDNMSFGEEKAYTYLGVNTEKVDDGVKITSVSENSPAEKAGLKKDDIIYKIDDTKITDRQSLTEIIRAKKDGDKVKVYFMRDGKKKDEKATLGTQKNTISKSFSYSMPDGSMKSYSFPKAPRAPRTPSVPRMYGNGGEDVFSEVFGPRQKLGLRIQDTEESNGVKVLEVEASSAAAIAGLMKDDVITDIGGVKVSTTDDAREQLGENSEKAAYAIKAKRNGTEMTFNIKIPKKLKTANL